MWRAKPVSLAPSVAFTGEQHDGHVSGEDEASLPGPLPERVSAVSQNASQRGQMCGDRATGMLEG